MMEWRRRYDQAGGNIESVGRGVAAWVEEVASEDGHAWIANRRLLMERMRVREVHQFVAQAGGLADLAAGIVQQILCWRKPLERWTAVKQLLARDFRAGAAKMDAEALKCSLSDPESTLGRFLTLAAVANLGADTDTPPPGWQLRFKHGRFPAHTWESASAQIASRPWRPSHPLCRWEYLAADLAQELFQNAPAPRRPQDNPREAGDEGGRTEAALTALYYRLERPLGGPAGGGQLSLFPVDLPTFLTEVQRLVHRRAGGEGVRQWALLLRHWCAQSREEPLWLSLSDLGGLGGASPADARTRRQRARKMLQVLELLEEVELQRVRPRGRHAAVSLSRLVAVLSREELRRGAGEAPESDLPNPLATRVRLALDPLLDEAARQGLLRGYEALPPPVLAASAAEHPFAVGLAAYLALAWDQPGGAAPGIAQGTAEQLFSRAGLWFRDHDRYRAVEQLKRDLARLRELGVIAQWRIVRGPERGAAHDQFRLEAPGRKAGAPRAPVPARELPPPLSRSGAGVSPPLARSGAGVSPPLARSGAGVSAGNDRR
jgi:hypothetical protein